MKTKVFWTLKEKELICKEAKKICFGGTKQIAVPFERGMLLDVGLKAQLVLPVERRRNGPLTTFKFIEEYLIDFITTPGNVVVEKKEELASEIDRLDNELRTKVAGMVSELLVKSPLFKEVVNNITNSLTEEIKANILAGNNTPREEIVVEERPVAHVRVVSQSAPVRMPEAYVLGLHPKQVAALREKAPYVDIVSLSIDQCKDAEKHTRKLALTDLVIYNDFTPKAMKDVLKNLRETMRKDIRKTRNSESSVLAELEARFKPAAQTA